MNRKPIYKTGDRVRIVNYGGLIWVNKNSELMELDLPLIGEDENGKWFDLRQEVVGKEGVVEEVSMTQGMPTYSISGIKEKHAWYNEDQMERIVHEIPANEK